MSFEHFYSPIKLTYLQKVHLYYVAAVQSPGF
jgi:hypothetical protein